MTDLDQDKELEILRDAVDKAELKHKNQVFFLILLKIINLVENFIKLNQLICYGRTAINNILPVDSQFYDKSIEIPDYDGIF